MKGFYAEGNGNKDVVIGKSYFAYIARLLQGCFPLGDGLVYPGR